ncbi:MAG: OmpA family protein [Deltaproteobacteria bacterium]|nr:OmpA family protein [Deltaproteobacteria bacterium]
MKRTATFFLSIILMAVFCSGCMVAESKYLTKVNEAQTLTDENTSLKKQITTLTGENASLKKQIATLTGQRDELDKILQAKTDDLSKSVSENRKKVADLEAENTRLKENLAQLQQKSQEAEAQSNTYKDLVQEMKAEVAKGEITITELKGKLTMDVVDKILFASGEAKVKKEGLAVLKRVVDVLKNVTDKNIRIEGHTDNVQIASGLAKVYPTNWELSAARALNVAKYLQEQGIDPKLISATAYSEYQPLADNGTPEGRAKNRRIAIILLPKE